MHKWLVSIVPGALCALPASPGAAQGVPPAESVPQARVAWTFNAIRICPELRLSEGGSGAVILFRVGRTGAPSQLTVGSASQSAALDEAALRCVSRLRFQPTIRMGDGEPIESWQQLTWTWAPQPQAQPTSATHPSESEAGAAAARQAAASTAQAANMPVTVRVCADGRGQLAQAATIVHSSGNPQLDDAALRVARAGAPYVPKTEEDPSGCAQLTIDFSAR